MGQTVTLTRLLSIRSKLKERGRSVVFTNGCFDLIHKGHLDYLKKSKSFGDVLIVAVNSDSSVRKVKGKGRPILPQKDRAEIIAALEPVDYVFIFNEETPLRVINVLKPDILVKGADYRLSEIVGAREMKSWGGQVKRVKLTQGRGTREIIQTILRDFSRS
ncbi:MAG: D-glycero-beta-D-manno-heptose 1-phosphate adenylyltransferase [Candidatus Zixiibacteriota bacterium]|nr:MAG: D-glycero-beta-D-manno-heptose 1-phosphate adenylyltransferase [candidate division Zixibacteria bacterium]